MHLLVPFASALHEAAPAVLRDLALPTLARLLQRLAPDPRHGVELGDEYTLSPPHEIALAQAWGWPAVDGALPFAARAAQADGIDVGARPWGLLTPAHWNVGRDQVTLDDPQDLALAADESGALFDAVRPLFETEGFTLAWGAPLRWYAAHDGLADLRCASLDRVIGRNVDLWLREDSPGTPARLLKRLQSEVQLMLYPHPINEAREARGMPTVNSFWLSGCGRARAADRGAVQVDESLRTPLLRQDWAAWAEAWRGLDRGALAALLARAEAGADVRLTLCGERHARSYVPRQAPWWQRARARWGAPAPHVVLEAL